MNIVAPLRSHLIRWSALAGLAALVVACGPSPAALRDAVLANDTEEVRRLIERGVDVNHPDSNGVTALVHAVQANQLELARLLIAHGADVNGAHPDQQGPGALHSAVAQGNREMVELLIGHGAQVEAQAEDGQTPLSLADHHGHKDLVILLRAHGARQ